MFLIYDKSRITLQSLAIAQNYYYLKQEKSRKVTTFFLYHQIFFKKNAKLGAFFNVLQHIFDVIVHTDTYFFQGTRDTRTCSREKRMDSFNSIKIH